MTQYIRRNYPRKPRRKWSWTQMQKLRSYVVREIVDELEDYWPLTVRQIHYRLVEAQADWRKNSIKRAASYENTSTHYQTLSKLLKWMRIDEHIPWEVLTDRTRRVSDKKGYEDLDEFIDAEVKWFLKGYDRCLVQSQDVYVEIWIEKDALSTIIEEVAAPFCLRVVTRRGYNSITEEADYYKRATAAIEKGQRPVVLYFGDWDPSGKDMLGASLVTLKQEMGLNELKTITVALTLKQVEKLPFKYGAAKEGDPRYDNFVKRYGSGAWELDALHPKELQEIARKGIMDVLDMETFKTEEELEMQDKINIEEFRPRALDAIRRAAEGTT